MRICEHCGKSKPVMLEMVGGKRGKPWLLCVACWYDGIVPAKAVITGLKVGGRIRN